MKTLVIKYLLGILFLGFAISSSAQNQKLTEQLKHAIKGKNAQIGVAVIIDGKDTVTLNNTTHYPMMSVFKFHQALAVMDYLNRNGQPIGKQLHISREDLKPDTYSPLRDKYPEGNIDMSIGDLLVYTLQQSDNNACDILFGYAGGPEATDRYIRSLGIEDFAITATEGNMHKEPESAYANWTTPLAAAGLLEIFLNKQLFPADYQDFIRQTMIECETGKDRLPRPLAGTKAVIGHKTGSSDRNLKGQIVGTNDIGFVFLPNNHHYSIAVFVKDSEENNRTNAQIISDISHIVYEYVNQLN